MLRTACVIAALAAVASVTTADDTEMHDMTKGMLEELMESLGYTVTAPVTKVASTGKAAVPGQECLVMDNLPNSGGVWNATEEVENCNNYDAEAGEASGSPPFAGCCSGDPGGERGQPTEDKYNRVDDPQLVCSGDNWTTCSSVVGRDNEDKQWDYISVAGGYPQGPPGTGKAACLEKAADGKKCAVYGPGKGMINATDNAWPIIVYVYHGLWIAFMFFWGISKLGDKPSGSTALLVNGDLEITGFKVTTMGKFGYYFYESLTLMFATIYLMLIFDTYWLCELRGPDNLCFRGAKPILGNGAFAGASTPGERPASVNAIVFFWCWCVGVSWAIFNYLYGSKVPNHFRSQCPMDQATHILCRRRGKTVVMSNPNKWVKLSRRLISAFASETEQFHEATSVIEISTVDNETKSFVFMCAQYTFNKVHQEFQGAHVELDLDYASLRASEGLSDDESKKVMVAIGPNKIPFGIDSWLSLLGTELSSYLYIYQFTFFLVWLWFGGLIWCSPQMIVVVICASMSVTIQRNNQEKINEIGEAGMDSVCVVKRGSKWVESRSQDLVPGDLLLLNQSNWTLPCDMVVTKGTCICDESGLTGESMPVRKAEVPQTAGIYDIHKDEKHTLFAGTNLLQADQEGSYAVVTNTGIRTAKGDLVSAILYPATMVFEYDEELKIIFACLSIYAAILFGISVWLQTLISPMNWVSIFAFACFTISQILPPLLPIALVIGHTKSAARLKKLGILSVQPKRIAISGKIHAFMFDKTGTLTKQGLDFIGIHRSTDSKFTPASGAASSQLAYNAASALANDFLTWSLATCHAVTYLRQENGEQSLVGNQVEVQMFTGSDWQLNDMGEKVEVTSKRTGEKLTIEKRFEFDHHTMTMSVVVRAPDGSVHVFCKGAPERVGALCVANTLPADFEAVSAAHAMDGCYVIGMSHKSMGNVSSEEIAKLTREQAESKGSLDFIGLLLFRNELKSDTKEAIAIIKGGDVRPVMVTGDNAHCGYYIARAAELITPGTTIFLSDSEIVGNRVTWSNMKVGAPANEQGISTDAVVARCEASKGTVELAITGKAMSVLTNAGKIHDLLLLTRIFARVQPDQKVQVISMFIARGFITGMCGDGGNDCGALRAAHCGIALSDAEASVVSPFTSSTKSVMSVVDVLCEGRCALVTSFAAYRFYITYGLNWSVVKTINFAYGVRMPITAYLTIDSICSWLCAWAITGALPLERTLLKYRPTSSLFAGNIFFSVVCPWLVWMGIMTIMLLEVSAKHADHTEMPPVLTKGVGYWELGDTWESTIFTYFQVCPLIWCGMCYSLGTKFRKSIVSNTPMIAVWGSIFIFYTVALLITPGKFSAFFHVASNGHNGFHTTSPVWMRYQMPRGCPSYNFTSNTEGSLAGCKTGQDCGSLVYAQAVGMDTWRSNDLPTPYVDERTNECAIIKMSVNKCKTACDNWVPGVPSPGMDAEIRGTLFGCVIAGMAFMMLFELAINQMYIKPSEWMVDGSVEQAEITGSVANSYVQKSVGGGGAKTVAVSEV